MANLKAGGAVSHICPSELKGVSVGRIA